MRFRQHPSGAGGDGCRCPSAVAQIDDLSFHEPRQSAASSLAMSGATLAEIAEVLGHKTLAMVKRCSHLTDQHTSKVVARMNEQVVGGPPG